MATLDDLTPLAETVSRLEPELHAAITARNQMIGELLADGVCTQLEIAEAIGVTQPAVNRIWRREKIAAHS